MSQSTDPGWTFDETTGRIKYDDATKKIYDDEATQAASTRLTSNNIQGYDEIVGISEESINTTLRLRFSNLLKKNKDKRLRHFDHSLPQFGDINAEMVAPHLKLAVAGASEAVRFFINFSKGSFQFWVGQGPSAQKRSQPVDGWRIALNVDFSAKQLATVPKAIQEKISLLKVNTYSVSQLLLGLSAASLASFDQNASSFPGISEDKDVQITVINAFKQYFEPYIEWLKTGPFSVLGYTIKVDQKASQDELMPPSFPPTKVRVRTQAYSPRTQAFKDKFPENPSAHHPTRGGLDAIIFQEMTETNDWPNGTYDEAKAGNWITGNIDCSLILSKSVFWDRYLLPKFSELNLQLLTVANNMYHWAKWSKKEQSNPWAINPGDKPTEAKWTNTASGAEYKWNGKSEEHDAGSHDDNTTTIANTMDWVSSSDIVKVKCSVTSTRDFFAPNDMGGHAFLHTTTLKWELTLTLGTIKAGELEAVITYGTPTVTSKRDDSQAIWWNSDLAQWYEDRVNKDITSNLRVDTIQKDLSGVLNGKGKFVFPGAGDFAMRDPKFSQSGDLFITLNLEGKAIEIDDDFELQVAAPGQTINGKWVKVAKDGDGADLVLVDDAALATKFQLSDGNLIVDIQGMPAGQHADSRDPSSQGMSDQGYLLQDIFFDGPDQKKTYEKLEFSTSGSGFFYSTDKGANWWPRFVLEGEKLRFYIGVPPAEGATLPVKPFLLNAIY